MEEVALVGRVVSATFIGFQVQGELVVWPKLCSMGVRALAVDASLEGNLLKIINSRVQAGFPLRRFFAHRPSLDRLPRLVEMKGRIEIIERDDWLNLRRNGMFYLLNINAPSLPYVTFLSSLRHFLSFIPFPFLPPLV